MSEEGIRTDYGKGRELLQKLKWTPGKGLGKNEDGEISLVTLTNNEGRKGFKCATEEFPNRNPRSGEKYPIRNKRREFHAQDERSLRPKVLFVEATPDRDFHRLP